MIFVFWSVVVLVGIVRLDVLFFVLMSCCCLIFVCFLIYFFGRLSLVLSVVLLIRLVGVVCFKLRILVLFMIVI